MSEKRSHNQFSAEPRKDQNYERVLNAPLGPLILSLALPSILSMLISSIYNMADAYFVGRLGTAASGAVGIAFPLMMIIQAISFTFGMGANSLISRFLGQKRIDEAQSAASSALFICIAINIIFSIAALSFLRPLLRLLGSTETILPYACDYASVILLGSPFISGSFVLNNLLRSQGLNLKAMIGLTIGGVINIILDPIFIYTFDLGISGASWATIISQAVSFFILFRMVDQKSVLLLSPRLVSKKLSIYFSIIEIGLPSFLRQTLGSLAVIISNNRASGFGDAAVAAFTVVGRISSFFLAFVLGAGQAFQPVVGYNYGAGRFRRVKEAYRFTLKAMIIAMALVSLLIFSLSANLVALFQPDPAVVEIGTLSLRLICLTFIFQPLLIATNMLYQSTGHARGASFLAALRNGLYFYPLMYTLPDLWGLRGLQLVQPAADLLSAATAVPMAIYFMNLMDKKIKASK